MISYQHFPTGLPVTVHVCEETGRLEAQIDHLAHVDDAADLSDARDHCRQVNQLRAKSEIEACVLIRELGQDPEMI
jgi:hypothetical protein